MLRVAIILAALAVLCSCGDVKFTDCGSKGKISSVQSGSCDDTGCDFVRGEKVDFDVKFMAGSATRSLTLKVQGVIGPQTFDWPGVEPDACKALQCPLYGGNTYEYKTTADILLSYPVIDGVKVIFTFTDDSSQKQVCFNFMANIVDP